MTTVPPAPDTDTDRPLPPPGAAPYFGALPEPNWPLIDAVIAGLGLLPAA